MAVAERPGFKEVRPGLYERIEDTRNVRITREFAARLERLSGSRALGQFLEAVIRKQEGEHRTAA